MLPVTRYFSVGPLALLQSADESGPLPHSVNQGIRGMDQKPNSSNSLIARRMFLSSSSAVSPVTTSPLTKA